MPIGGTVALGEDQDDERLVGRAESLGAVEEAIEVGEQRLRVTREGGEGQLDALDERYQRVLSAWRSSSCACARASSASGNRRPKTSTSARRAQASSDSMWARSGRNGRARNAPGLSPPRGHRGTPWRGPDTSRSRPWRPIAVGLQSAAGGTEEGEGLLETALVHPEVPTVDMCQRGTCQVPTAVHVSADLAQKSAASFHRRPKYAVLPRWFKASATCTPSPSSS